MDQGEIIGYRERRNEYLTILRKRREKNQILDELQLQLAILVRSENPRIVPEGSTDAISGDPIKNGDMMYDVDRMFYNPSPNYFRSDGIDTWYIYQQERGLPFYNPVSGVPIAVMDKYIAQVGPNRPTTFNFKTTPKKNVIQKITSRLARMFGRAPPLAQEDAEAEDEDEDEDALEQRGSGRKKAVRGGNLTPNQLYDEIGKYLLYVVGGGLAAGIGLTLTVPMVQDTVNAIREYLAQLAELRELERQVAEQQMVNNPMRVPGAHV
jgi:hypothetical protein